MLLLLCFVFFIFLICLVLLIDVATSCLPITTEDRCVEATLNGISGTFCYCSTDLCNIESSKNIILYIFSMRSILNIAIHLARLMECNSILIVQAFVLRVQSIMSLTFLMYLFTSLKNTIGFVLFLGDRDLTFLCITLCEF